MPRIVVTDVTTGEVEEGPSFGGDAVRSAKKDKKRKREREAAAPLPPPARPAAAAEEDVPPPRKHKPAPPAVAKADRAQQPPAAARPPKQPKKPKAGAVRLDLAALPVAEQARCALRQAGCTLASRRSPIPCPHPCSALWESYKAECGGSFLEEEAFAAEHVLPLPPGPSLQGRLKAATPDWRDTLARPPPGAPPAAPSVLVIAGAALVR